MAIYVALKQHVPRHFYNKVFIWPNFKAGIQAVASGKMSMCKDILDCRVLLESLRIEGRQLFSESQDIVVFTGTKRRIYWLRRKLKLYSTAKYLQLLSFLNPYNQNHLRQNWESIAHLSCFCKKLKDRLELRYLG
ncbi:hypothetical protein TNCV_460761 [Trichonephila clavipes]|nr:hypothetical protein TNCV_460761 [Trichonephila clavipes]